MANPRLTQKNPTRSFECECGKRYKHSSSLSKHRKKCSTQHVGHILGGNQENTYIVKEEPEITTEMFNKLVDQNHTLMEKLVELSKEKKVINYQNCNNKKMTINVFLNERCKDAMNLTEFMENVKVSLADLMYTKDHGYVKGISNIFVRHLSNLDPMERPDHGGGWKPPRREDAKRDLCGQTPGDLGALGVAASNALLQHDSLGLPRGDGEIERLGAAAGLDEFHRMLAGWDRAVPQGSCDGFAPVDANPAPAWWDE